MHVYITKKNTNKLTKKFRYPFLFIISSMTHHKKEKYYSALIKINMLRQSCV